MCSSYPLFAYLIKLKSRHCPEGHQDGKCGGGNILEQLTLVPVCYGASTVLSSPHAPVLN